MNNKNSFILASSFVLLAFIFYNQNSFAQIPKVFLEFIETQNKVQSAYVKFRCTYMTDNDTTNSYIGISYFVHTPNNYKYFVINQSDNYTDLYCKSGKTILFNLNRKDYIKYRKYEQTIDPTEDQFQFFEYPNFKNQLDKVKNRASFIRIPPKVDENNIRFRIIYSDNEMETNNTIEWEFNRKTFHWVHEEHGATIYNTEKLYGSCEILESKFYDYIHPDILDTISFRYEELRKQCDLQIEKERDIKDSLKREKLLDSIMKFAILKENPLTNNISEDNKNDTLKYMPSWKAPLLSGDTLFSESIQSRYLFIDMWYISCLPCRVAMKELGSIDTLFEDSLVKFISMNVADKDSAKMCFVVNNIGFDSEIVCTYDSRIDTLISEKMGDCYGYPQLYLVDMKTKQVVWRSCGYFEGFTKEIETILRKDK